MRKHRPSRPVAWLLALVILVSPFAHMQANAGESAAMRDITAKQQEFAKVYHDIMSVKPIEIDWLTSKVLCIADSAKGQDWGSIEAQIKEANQSIAEAQQQARQAKSVLDLEAARARTLATETDGVKSDLVGTGKAKAQLQEGLRTAGEQLQKVGDMLSLIGTVLGVATAIMAVLTVATGGALGGPLIVLGKVATVISVVGVGLSEAGRSLIAAGQKGADTDNAVATAITRGVAMGALAYIGGRVGNAVVGKVAGSASKYLSQHLGKSIKLPTNVDKILTKMLSHSKTYDKLSEKSVQNLGESGAEQLDSSVTKLIGKARGVAGIPDAGKVINDNVFKPTVDVIVPKPQPGLSIPQGER